MRSFPLCRCCLLSFVIAIASLGASAQSTNPERPKAFTVGISVDSDDARFTVFLPALRHSLLKTIQGEKQVRAVAVDLLPQETADTAKTKGCNYLLQLSLDRAGNPYLYRGGIVDETPDRRHELDRVRINYWLQSLKGHDLNLKRSDYILPGEYPSFWDATAFETTVIRAVTRVAVRALNDLPKK